MHTDVLSVKKLIKLLNIGTRCAFQKNHEILGAISISQLFRSWMNFIIVIKSS